MQDQQISLQVSSQKNWYVLKQMRKQQTRKELKTKFEIHIMDLILNIQP